MLNNHHNSRHNRQYPGAERPFRQIAVAVLLLLSVLSLITISISVSWNYFAPEVLGFAELGVRTAAGVVLFVFTIGFILRLTFTSQWRRHGRRQQQF